MAALTALLTAAAVPVFRATVGRLYLRQDAESVAELLRYARQRARTAKAPVRAVPDPEDGCLRLEQFDGERYRPLDGPLARRCTGVPAAIEPPGAALEFGAGGQAGPARVLLRRAERKGFAVVVDRDAIEVAPEE